MASCLSEAAAALFLFLIDPRDELVKMSCMAKSVQYINLLKIFSFSHIHRYSDESPRGLNCGCPCSVGVVVVPEIMTRFLELIIGIYYEYRAACGMD